MDFPFWQNFFLGNIQKSFSEVQMRTIAYQNIRSLVKVCPVIPLLQHSHLLWELNFICLHFKIFWLVFCYWWAVCFVCRLIICGLNAQPFLSVLWLGARLTWWFTDSFGKCPVQTTKAIWCLQSSNHRNSVPFLYLQTQLVIIP